MGHILKGQVRYTLAVEDVIQQGEIPTDLQGISSLTFASGVSASFDENIDADSTVYTVAAQKPDGTTSGITYGISGTDASDFTINANTGVITIDASPNFEDDPSYAIIVTANHADFDAITRNVALAVNNLDEVAPTITSGATATAIAENSGAGQVIYTVTVDDSGDTSGGVTFALANSQSDSSLFSINSTTGAVTLTGNPDFETKSSYTFAVVATDAAGNQNAPFNVTLAITNVVDVVPTFTASTVTAGTVAEANSTPLSTAIYDVDTNLNDSDGAVHTLNIANVSTGFVGFILDSNNVIRTTNALDYETATSHDLAIVASYTLADGTNGSVSFTLTVPVSNVDDTAPVFTSSTTAIYLAQGIDANEAVYTAQATDTGDGTNGNITYSLTNDAGGRFTIDSSTGVVTNATPPASGSAWTAGTSQIITIRATDDAGNFADRTQSFFAVNAPGFGSGNAGVTVPESQAIFSPPGSGVQASHIFHTIDMADAESLFDFYLIDSNGDEQNSTGGFSILSDGSSSLGGGLFKVSGQPAYDHETTSSYSITVRAKRKTSPLIYATTTISVAVLDAGISFANSTTSKTIAENSGAGQLIYQPFPSVNDPQYDTSDITYVLGGADASHFTVLQHQANNVSMSGAVTLTADPDYETKSSYAVTLTANGPGSPPADTLSANITVTITDVAESVVLETYDLSSNYLGSPYFYEGYGTGYVYNGQLDGTQQSVVVSAQNLITDASNHPGAKIVALYQYHNNGFNTPPYTTRLSISTPGSEGLVSTSSEAADNWAWNTMDVLTNNTSTVLSTLNKSDYTSYSQTPGSTHQHYFIWNNDTTRRFTDTNSGFSSRTEYDIEFKS